MRKSRAHGGSRAFRHDKTGVTTYLELENVLRQHKLPLSHLIHTALRYLLDDFPALREAYNEHACRSPSISRAKLREIDRLLQEEIEQMRLARQLRKLRNFGDRMQRFRSKYENPET